MKQALILLFAMVFVAKFSHSQIIDRFGINAGVSYTNQTWDYKLVDIDHGNEYKLGIQAFLQAEKDIGKLFAVRTEFGYIQKGFRTGIEFTFPNGTPAGSSKDNVILHNLALNAGVKFKPFQTMVAPYALLGLRGDYMIAYRDAEYEEPGSGLEVNPFESVLEEFNRFNLGGLVGLGVSIKNLVYLEAEYNPSFTRNLDEPGLSVRDIAWGARLGVNINELIK